ncbi:BTAD domain-containing putative transcriptional regulator [Streptomyces sp. NPDC015131]|uniref:AfsR/SARP family transcriptional regulator n=1 Tax=Streptomyces sp. NPDC015131 TaxID=3364941 RepID=UPI0036FAA7FD
MLLRELGAAGGGGSPSLRFRLFGPLQVTRGREVLELGPPKQRALLAVLLLRPGMETGVDQLTASLWGEDYPAYAKNLIQKSVSGLRGLLAGGEHGVRLEWSGGGYLLDTGGAYVDLYAYERLASAGIAAAREGEVLQAARLLEEARTMSTGPLAEGLDGPMLERERLYRQERFLADMEVRAELELELGRHRNAVPYLYYAVHKYPFRERFVWLLMLALYRSDRGSEALAVYAGHRTRVVEELGAEPGPSLRSLQAQLLLQDPQLMVCSSLRLDSGAPAAAPALRPTAPLARRGPFD